MRRISTKPGIRYHRYLMTAVTEEGTVDYLLSETNQINQANQIDQTDQTRKDREIRILSRLYW